MIDWKLDRSLLFKAYPQGLLPMRGVRTVAGWQCVSVSRHETTAGTGGAYLNTMWLPPDDTPGIDMPLSIAVYPDCITYIDRSDAAVLAHRVERGDLLPLPDPNDPATWACMLADLASSLQEWDDVEPVYGLTWRPVVSGGVVSWSIRGASSVISHFAAPPRCDPGESLVRARVAMRRST